MNNPIKRRGTSEEVIQWFKLHRHFGADLILMTQRMAARVSKDNFEAEVLQASIPVLVEFYSDSCIPCKQMSPILGDIEDDYEDRLKVVKVNANFDGELAEQYSVMVSPTILFFKDGKEAERVRGLIKKPELEDIVKKYI